MAPLWHTTKVLIYLKTTCQQPRELGSRHLSCQHVRILSLIPSMAKLCDKVSQTLCGVQNDCPENVVNDEIQYRWDSSGANICHIPRSSAEKYTATNSCCICKTEMGPKHGMKRGFVFPSAALSLYHVKFVIWL